MADMSEYQVYFETTEANFIRQLLESLKEFIAEASLTFSEKGISLSHKSSSDRSIAYLFLEGCKFQKYYISEVTPVGIDLHTLNRLTKTASQRDVLSMYIYKGSTNININIENEKICTTFAAPTLDANITQVQVPSTRDYIGRVIIESSMLQKIVRDFDTVNNHMDIRLNGKDVIFCTKSPLGVQRKTVLKTIPVGAEYEPSPAAKPPRRAVSTPRDVHAEFRGDGMYAATFDTKELIPLLKTSALSAVCTLKLRRDKPLILMYTTGNLGVIHYALQPINKL